MFLPVPAHPGCPGQNPESRKTVVCVCVCLCLCAGYSLHDMVFILPNNCCNFLLFHVSTTDQAWLFAKIVKLSNKIMVQQKLVKQECKINKAILR